MEIEVPAKTIETKQVVNHSLNLHLMIVVVWAAVIVMVVVIVVVVEKVSGRWWHCWLECCAEMSWPVEPVFWWRLALAH